MSLISIKIADKDWKTLAVNRGDNEVSLVYSGEYTEETHIIVEISEKNTFYKVRLDDGNESAILYLTDNVYYKIPFGEKRINMSDKVFKGSKHVLSVRRAYDFEIESYRNLAFNPWDQHGDVTCYPHAMANVETRGESVFAAMNAIDGYMVTCCHGEWPYQSWGINRRDDAVLKIDFGRQIETDRIILYTRADYPHDNWWKSATVTFSDGSSIELSLEKKGTAQEFTFDKRCISWLELGNLIKSEEASPFPALTQIEVYGREKEKN